MSDLVNLTDDDREILKEVGDLLLGMAEGNEIPTSEQKLSYLAGRIHGLSGRVPIEELMEN